jgi:hypothetical protein
MTSPRRFPPPWSVEDIGAAHVVKDNKAKMNHSAGNNFCCNLSVQAPDGTLLGVRGPQRAQALHGGSI